MWYGQYWMFGMHLLWWIFWIVLIVGAIVLVLRNQSRPPAPPPPSAQPPEPTPLQLLERRYAAGEVSTEEFEERKAHLTGQRR